MRREHSAILCARVAYWTAAIGRSSSSLGGDLALDIFPLTWRWQILVAPTSEGSASTAAEAIRCGLRAEGADATMASGNAVDFRCPGVTGMSRWALLAPISSGAVVVEDSPGQLRVSYTLRFVLIFWVALAATLIFLLFQGISKPTIESSYPFLWLFGGNVAISLWRFPDFLRRTLTTSPPNPRLERP
jgi:hypothetical protein